MNNGSEIFCCCEVLSNSREQLDRALIMDALDSLLIAYGNNIPVLSSAGDVSELPGHETNGQAWRSLSFTMETRGLASILWLGTDRRPTERSSLHVAFSRPLKNVAAHASASSSSASCCPTFRACVELPSRKRGEHHTRPPAPGHYGRRVRQN